MVVDQVTGKQLDVNVFVDATGAFWVVAIIANAAWTKITPEKETQIKATKGLHVGVCEVRYEYEVRCEVR
jgi:hypothetical protein